MTSEQKVQPNAKEVSNSSPPDDERIGREFCKCMIVTCLVAVPVYAVLIHLLVPDNEIVPDVVGIVQLLSIGFSVVAACVFTASYLPGRTRISRGLNKEASKIIDSAINRRYWLGVIGFALFSAGIFAGAGGLVLENIHCTSSTAVDQKDKVAAGMTETASQKDKVAAGMTETASQQGMSKLCAFRLTLQGQVSNP